MMKGCQIPPAYGTLQAGLCSTLSEARRLISQGGGYVNSERINTFDQVIGPGHILKGAILLTVGKKRHVKVMVT